nr:MAG TPA: hypothetical protein [Bacteriophage sp.]
MYSVGGFSPPVPPTLPLKAKRFIDELIGVH